MKDFEGRISTRRNNALNILAILMIIVAIICIIIIKKRADEAAAGASKPDVNITDTVVSPNSTQNGYQ